MGSFLLFDLGGPRSGHQLFDCRTLARNLRGGRSKRIFVCRCIETRERLTGSNRVTFINQHFGNSPGHPEAELDLPNVNVSVERELAFVSLNPTKLRGSVERPRRGRARTTTRTMMIFMDGCLAAHCRSLARADSLDLTTEF